MNRRGFLTALVGAAGALALPASPVLVLPERRYWALDRTMAAPTDSLHWIAPSDGRLVVSDTDAVERASDWWTRSGATDGVTWSMFGRGGTLLGLNLTDRRDTCTSMHLRHGITLPGRDVRVTTDGKVARLVSGTATLMEFDAG